MEEQVTEKDGSPECFAGSVSETDSAGGLSVK